MAVKGIKDWITGAGLEDEEFLEEEFSNSNIYEEITPDQTQAFENKQSQMVVFEPRSYSESQGIADHLKSGRGCIINLHRVTKDQAKRIIDFLSGVSYAIVGTLQKIGDNVFLCTPSNFGVYGEISESEQ